MSSIVYTDPIDRLNELVAIAGDISIQADQNWKAMDALVTEITRARQESVCMAEGDDNKAKASGAHERRAGALGTQIKEIIRQQASPDYVTDMFGDVCADPEVTANTSVYSHHTGVGARPWAAGKHKLSFADACVIRACISRLGWSIDIRDALAEQWGVKEQQIRRINNGTRHPDMTWCRVRDGMGK